ncbi:PhoH-like protein [Acinetobacter phage Herod]|nr:PhoH-like protein [Acinetobacter phage Herod]
MGKNITRKREDGRNTRNRDYRQEIGERDLYISEKHKQQREEYIKQNPIVPLNPKQRRYMELLDEKKCIIATGFAGTSKTYIPTAIFADLYRTGKLKKIVLIRPAVSNSKSLGYFAGTIEQKSSVWLAPVIDVLYKRLGRASTLLAIANGDIEFVPMETVKGRSFDEDTGVIVTEAEDCTKEEIMSLLTRQNGCKMVIEGDVRQSALREESGLKLAIDLYSKHKSLQETMGLINFDDVQDIVRSPECKIWIKVFVKEKLM